MVRRIQRIKHLFASK